MLALENAGEFISLKIKEMEVKESYLERTLKKKDKNLNNINQNHTQQIEVYK